MDTDCYVSENAFGRWVIVNAANRDLAWSGSRWVAHRNGLPAGGVQVSNFERAVEAYENAVQAGLKPLTYSIAAKGENITCFKCGMTSWNENDVRERYCGNCHEFHHLGRN
jgi:hypothetical protein